MGKGEGGEGAEAQVACSSWKSPHIATRRHPCSTCTHPTKRCHYTVQHTKWEPTTPQLTWPCLFSTRNIGHQALSKTWKGGRPAEKESRQVATLHRWPFWVSLVENRWHLLQGHLCKSEQHKCSCELGALPEKATENAQKKRKRRRKKNMTSMAFLHCRRTL